MFKTLSIERLESAWSLEFLVSSIIGVFCLLSLKFYNLGILEACVFGVMCLWSLEP